ncbi:hypothetical protein PMAYCL1PPCAC_02365, partial [Pristionchus mayeri]
SVVSPFARLSNLSLSLRSITVLPPLPPSLLLWRALPSIMSASPYYSQDLTARWVHHQTMYPPPLSMGGMGPPPPPEYSPPSTASHSPSTAIQGEGPPQMRKLFVGGLHYDTTSEQLRAFFSRWGPVVDAVVMRDASTKQSRGFGFVTFATFSGAEQAMVNRPHYINGKMVDSKRAIPREQMTNIYHSPLFDYDIPHGCKLEVTGISCDFHSVEALRKHFEQFGVVDQIELLIKDRGFVVFEAENDAIRCLAIGEHVINGRLTTVKPFSTLDYWTEMGFPKLK